MRKRVVEAYKKQNKSHDEITELFGVGRACLSRWLRLDREKNGNLEPEPHGGGNPPKIAASEYGLLRVLVRQTPDATRDELCAEWLKARGVKVSLAAMGRALKEAGFTRKKSSGERRSKTVLTLSSHGGSTRSG